MNVKPAAVDIRVHLSESSHYVLTRFLLSKMLTFCAVPEDVATRIGVTVKKELVHAGRISITQTELEVVTQQAMAMAGLSIACARLFPVVVKFYEEPFPLVLFLAGPPKSGKTTLARELGSRLHCGAVLNAEVLAEVDSCIDATFFGSASGTETGRCHMTSPSSAEHGTSTAVRAEVDKALTEGRRVIVEGEGLVLSDFHRLLTPGSPSSAGAVVLGVLIEGLQETTSDDAIHDCPYPREGRENLYEAPGACVFRVAIAGAAAAAEEEEDFPVIYIARRRSVSDNTSVCEFLHQLVMRHIIDELQRRGTCV